MPGACSQAHRATAHATCGCSGSGPAAVLETLQCALHRQELFASPSMTVVAGGVIAIRGASASGSSPNTPVEAATEGYREWAERLQHTVLHRCATPAWCLLCSGPFLCSTARPCFPKQDKGTDCWVLQASQLSDQSCCCPDSCTSTYAYSSVPCILEMGYQCKLKGEKTWAEKIWKD